MTLVAGSLARLTLFLILNDSLVARLLAASTRLQPSCALAPRVVRMCVGATVSPLRYVSRYVVPLRRGLCLRASLLKTDVLRRRTLFPRLRPSCALRRRVLLICVFGATVSPLRHLPLCYVVVSLGCASVLSC